ncbi:TlpA family protein disulfide reductase [Chitinophaga sp. GCM10012297]|uniref:TlpA family protein disulfide reductase n=1 Tax=Chitinophaga chungangae TaxID=2821488 RepID=A0ABS3YJG6_9BACT|nr:TlpA disulfide reductase family protein [Chitinophaga chungangae]MBO9154832.1 TlpA family protein disulfide reductase [Chitinophaga chungangae]
MSKKVNSSFFLCLIIAFGGVGPVLGQSDGNSQISDSQNKNSSVTSVRTSSAVGGSTGENANIKTVSAADSIWNRLLEIERNLENDIITVETEKNLEVEAREYLKIGLLFWKNYPDDQRKYQWATSRLLNTLKFWQDAEKGAEASLKSEYYSSPVDRDLLNRWGKNQLILQAEIKKTPTLSAKRKIDYFTKDLRQELTASKNDEYRGNTEDFLERVVWKLDNCLSVIGSGNPKNALLILGMLFLGTDNYNLSFQDLRYLLNRYENHPNPQMRAWVEQKLRLLDLDNIPLRFSGTSMDGQEINLERLKGKVVLLDFWNIYCSVCIERMPAVKAAYDKLRKSGFEVISMYAGPDSDTAKIKEIEERVGTDWPVVILGNASEGGQGIPVWNDMRNRYGFQFVPQLLLLDKNGKLARLNGSLMDRDITTEIERVLKK